MKYKVAIVDTDSLYLSRITKVFGDKYSEKLDLFAFSNFESFDNNKDKNKFDVVMFAEGMIEANQIPEKMVAVFLISENDIDKIDGIKTICKYQRHEIILKQIIELCLDSANVHYTKKNILGNESEIIYVTSACGGTGTTTIAVSLAKSLARSGEKVLYLSFEKNPATNFFFPNKDNASFSDVIYMIKSRKNNLLSRVENIVQKDDSGVFFIQPCRMLFDMNEISVDDLGPLLEELCSMGSYDKVVIDNLLEYNNNGFFMCDYADHILIVSNGTEIGEYKLEKMQEALCIWDEEKNTKIMSKTKVVYNRFSSKNGYQSPNIQIPILGGTPKYEGIFEKQMTDMIGNLEMFQTYY